MLSACLGRFTDDVAGLLLGSHKQNAVATGDHVFQEVQSGLEEHQALGEVDDVDAVALIEDIALHFRVPALGLVSEMETCFKQVAYADAGCGAFYCICHNNLLMGQPGA